MMRTTVVALLVGAFTLVKAQPFALEVPKGWEGEEIPFPIEFAPSIPYTGVEYLRFSPGWGDPDSKEHWAYCFVWLINGDAIIDAESLDRDMKQYYDGLVGRNVISRKIDSSLVVQTIARFIPDKTEDNAFMGTVHMLDYHTSQPIVLNIHVKIYPCRPEKQQAILFTVSPLPATEAIWKIYEHAGEVFRCTR